MVKKHQKGGVRRVTGILQTAYFKDGQKIDTNALVNPAGRDLYWKLHDMYDRILEHVQRNSTLQPAIVITREDTDALDAYPLLEAVLYTYKGDGDPQLPKDLKVNLPGNGLITIKFEQFVPIKVEEVGAGVGAAAGPIGAGAGPAVPPVPAPPAEAEEDSDSDEEGTPRGDVAMGEEKPDKHGDEKMKGGKKRRSKTKKNKKRYGKKKHTRRRS